MAEDCCSFQLISGAGVLNVEGLENFTRTTNLAQRRLSYAAVAVIGPQSSGKSTLLNKLFRTDFTMMDAYEGRGQTTQGIWIGKGIGIEPFTIAIDVEGSDSSERGQDGTTTFEKRSALFALAIADIVIINMWCHDIGRDNAASRPLLKTVFEAMTRLFGARKTTLLFVLRDQTPTPLERLKHILRRDIDQIWAAAAKSKAQTLGDFFNVEIIALPNFLYEKERFNEQVALLRQRFIHSISPGGLVGDRKDVQPASGFPLRVEQIWKTIKENKDLDLPALEVMVATFRCEQIAKEKLSSLKLDGTWLAMSKALKSGPVSEFGKKLSSILESYLSQYDKEAMDYEESIRKDKQQRLETEALQFVYPAYAAMLQHLRSTALKSFKTRLEKTVKEKRGDGFEESVDNCGWFGMLEFERGCEDATIKKRVSGWLAEKVNVKDRLRGDIETLKSNKKAEYKVAQLRQRFVHSIYPGGLVGDREEVEPASGFPLRAEEIWKIIKDNRDLDLPAVKVMVATVRCEEIAGEKLKCFTTDEDWLEMKEAVQAGPVSGFGGAVSSILETYLSEYDREVEYFDQEVRNEKRRQLLSNALMVVRDAYDTMLMHLYSNTVKSFKTSLEQSQNVAAIHLCSQSCMSMFDQGCEDAAIQQSEWDASKFREKLICHMLSEMMAKYKKQITLVLAKRVESLLEAGERDTWASIRNLFECNTEAAVSEFSDAAVSFNLHSSEIDTKLQHLRKHARKLLKKKARQAADARRVLMRMKDRFAKVFNHDENSKSGAWTTEQNIEEIDRNALSASLKILEIMAAIRLDQTTDQIEHVLFSSLMDGNGAVPASGAPPDLLTSNAWEEVSPNATLLTPVECKSLWMQFKADIKYIMNQATSAQQTLRQAKRAITIVVGVVVVVGAAVVATVGTPTAMGIAARPEVAAVLKAVGPGLAAVMKDIGPEVLATLKDIGPEVAGAVRSLGPQIVTAVIAMMTNGFARPHQQ
ncbi:protein ROOT HAIR DEFECTIVE 3 homolog 2 isoform X10 [Populus trichocarpa]|uniref:protein ROOT HAIR DEFECTIVE 3 homolog 2 isoform X7 n=1 Tax=Populus trichocarpa TaxID=3694 RepID=UPI0022784E50|nr:protein ROOT HAIR DEFECTIVE 3 homolog 2 isoform X7 [Populus trichocarpa]XP_052301855.1 protein ROOT HAIR DEFECTIVE 3 homolog 2 isoform X9 [Populus trichocarpa]XP_052301856.1 protein ROOT HAIR DEFECTIVE 3 homolog 2 isoform X10 [Populus trichocarpa]